MASSDRASATSQRSRSLSEAATDPEVLAPIRDQVARHQMPIVTIATAPLMGLLVTGMIETFDSLTSMSMQADRRHRRRYLRGPLETQMGLAVAVPALLVGRLMDTCQSQCPKTNSAHPNAMCRQALQEHVASFLRRNKKPSDLDISPLIDVVFILSIFFGDDNLRQRHPTRSREAPRAEPPRAQGPSCCAQPG